MSTLYDDGYSYAYLNTARSGLSILLGPINGVSIGENYLVTRLLKGVSRLRPPTCKYNVTWDPSVVLKYIKELDFNKMLSLRFLGIKLCGLLALCSGQRCQTIVSIQTDQIIFMGEKVVIKIDKRLKTSRPGVGTTLEFPKFDDEKLCVYKCLNEYILRTQSVRKCNQLLIHSRSPYDKVSEQTVSNWLKELLNLSGVDTTVFTSHSFRHASTSKAASVGVSIDTIFKAAGWSEKSKTFAKFYHKPIIKSCNFANAVLNSVHDK